MLTFSLLLIATASSSTPTATRHYSNVRFGFSIDVPSDWEGQGESANGDGQHFVSSNKTTRLSVYGVPQGGSSLAEQYAEATKPKPGRSVTYKAMQDGWFVVSGTEGQTIFYSRLIRTSESFAQFDLRFDQASKAAIDPLIAPLSKSFRAVSRCAPGDSTLEGTVERTEWNHPNPEIGKLVAYLIVLPSGSCFVVDSTTTLSNVLRVHLLSRDDKQWSSMVGKVVKVHGTMGERGTVYHRGDAVLFDAALDAESIPAKSDHQSNEVQRVDQFRKWASDDAASTAKVAMGILHPTGKNFTLQTAEVVEGVDGIDVVLDYRWKGGILGAAYQTVVRWHTNANGHVQAKIIKDTAMIPAAASHVTTLDAFFRDQVFPKAVAADN